MTDIKRIEWQKLKKMFSQPSRAHRVSPLAAIMPDIAGLALPIGAGPRMLRQEMFMLTTRGVMLLPLDAPSYQSACSHHAFLARVNTGTKVPDPRQAYTAMVEQQVRLAVGQSLPLTRYRVLRWEDRDVRNRFVPRFRELDGVFAAPKGVSVLLEVKASASKSSIRSGLDQLRAAVRMVSHVHPATVGLLVVSDLGEWCEGFGPVAAPDLPGYFGGMDVELLAWPPRLPAGKTSGICVSLVPGQMLGEWLDVHEGDSPDEIAFCNDPKPANAEGAGREGYQGVYQV